MIGCLPSIVVKNMAGIKGLGVEFVEGILGAPLLYGEREPLEKDETFRQVIPYVVLDLGNDIVGCYIRTGDEKRLTGKVSVGIGGHIQESENVWHALTREFEEELGIAPDLSRLLPIGGILLNETPVDKVHVGLVFLYRTNIVEFTAMSPSREITHLRTAVARGLLLHKGLETWGKEALKLREKYYADSVRSVPERASE